jgi:hypothetical protein
MWVDLAIVVNLMRHKKIFGREKDPEAFGLTLRRQTFYVDFIRSVEKVYRKIGRICDFTMKPKLQNWTQNKIHFKALRTLQLK